MFTIMNADDNLLNIRKFDGDDMPIWNSFKEKRFWFTLDKEQAFNLLNKAGGNTRVVEIVEVSGNDNYEEKD